MNELIFVSLAAYRDLQLAPTVADCLAKARRPERLRFGICWQHGAEEGPLPFLKGSRSSGDGRLAERDRFRVLDVPWQESRGACWARAAVMRLWDGEEWLLQVDSHCRFARGWDERLIETARATKSSRPILSTYATPFVPSTDGKDEILQGAPLMIGFQGFTPEGTPHMKPMAIPNWQRLDRPLRARFVSAGFLFAGGTFVTEVGYDPELYFLGEEAAITVRAFTHGYDLFHPRETIVWHDYVRKDATKHWDDHAGGKGEGRDWGELDWSELDRLSKAKVQRLLSGEPVESYGLGSVRSLGEYERYAGISFRLQKAQEYTVRCREPPNPEAPANWAEGIFSWIVRIRLERAGMPAGSLEDPLFWYLGIHDEAGNEIHRKDFLAEELGPVLGDEAEISLVCEFESGSLPSRWTVWPVSRSRGWLRKMDGLLGKEDFSVLVEDDR